MDSIRKSGYYKDMKAQPASLKAKMQTFFKAKGHGSASAPPKSPDNLRKTFFWLSAVLLAVFVFIYVLQVRDALNMDPNSYGCTDDSMMMQICHYPYSSSVTWSLLYIGFFGWPFLIAWAVMCFMLLKRRRTAKKDEVSKR